MRAKITAQHRPHHATSVVPETQATTPANWSPAVSPTTGPLTRDELHLAARNHEAPLESLRWPVSPPGLHYILTHFDVPDVDPVEWRLRLGGAVAHPLEFTLSDLRRRPRRTLTVTLECAGNGRSRLEPRPISQPWDLGGFGTAEWTGTPLAPLLDEAGLEPEALELVFEGEDRGFQDGVEHLFARSLPITEASSPDVLLAYEMNGAPLPPQHGYPLRLVVPGWYGMASVKWLRSINAVAEPFEGYQQAVAYRYQADADDGGTRVERVRVRSLMVPPGVPDFLTRRRTVDAGPTMLRGRAWSGTGPITKVEVGVDGVWATAQLEPPVGPYAWQEWSCPWVATAGEHRLACRAHDAAGNVQPEDAPWNLQGMGNNSIQTLDVEVRDLGAAS
ncbi:sulfite oxidase [Sinomonas sp. ASV322]|uniref:sulfite oxidase n=1 Tax=Sinomonas sp. ASV322 TaxID=3041920 RepID=UPI0027DB76FE|nr:sulfite oxidase [Sinomonas sp. ASV322]MDQ4503036.1 sulfite oxidase [Sinomonas sp. ASV322]